IFMPYGSNTAQGEYKLRDCQRGIQPKLELRPLTAFREHHSTTHENGALDPSVEIEPNLISVQPYSGLPRLYFAHNAQNAEKEGRWYHNFLYRIERERGLGFHEDLFSPLVLRRTLNLRQKAAVIASTDAHDVRNAA